MASTLSLKIVFAACKPAKAALVTFLLRVKVRGPAPEIVNLGAPAGEEPTCDIVGVPLTLFTEPATYSIPVGKVTVIAELAKGRVTLTVSVPASKFLLPKCTGSSANGCDSID